MAKTVSVICSNCGKEKVVPTKEFNRWKGFPDKKWFCDSSCASSYKHKSSVVSCRCPVCDSKFTRLRSELGKCCSTRCANILRFSDENERIKLSLVNSPTVRASGVRYCRQCGKFMTSGHKLFCSVACSKQAHWDKVFDKIKTSGSFPATTHGETDRRVAKKFIGETSGYKCAICGKADCKLVVDHIDGDACNSQIENVRLLCIDCDRNTPTYKNRPHKANRPWRRKVKVAC